MPERTSSVGQKPPGVSRAQIRKVVLEVKNARAHDARRTTSKSPSADPSLVERYLGHFGVGQPSRKAGAAASKASARKKVAAAKKTSPVRRKATKKASAKSLRRAS